MRPVRIAHLVVELAVGGTEVMVTRIVRRLDPKRFSSIVISFLPGGPIEAELRRLGVPVFCLGAKRGVPDPRSLLRLHQILREEKIDLIQSYSYAPNLYGLIGARTAGIPVIWSLRCSKVDLAHHTLSGVISFQLNRLLSRLADLIVANSEAGRIYHRSRGYSSTRMMMIPNGFELDRFRRDDRIRSWLREELGVSKETVLIGHVARFNPIKDHRTLVRASALAFKSHHLARLVMIGRGVTSDNKAITEWLVAEGMKESALLLGERADVDRIMPGLDFLVSSSEDEGFPNVIAEAMACGIPCVATDAGDSRSIIGDTGLVVPVRDPKALGRAMVQMLDGGPELRSELGRSARKRIETRFDIGVVAQRFEMVYDRLLSGSRGWTPLERANFMGPGSI